MSILINSNYYALVSIVMPTYNCLDFIEETIQSILAQTYNHWELIIYDDASTDNMKQIVDEYIKGDNRIKYFRNEVNCGVSVTRNRALQQAKGRWIAFLDSDDVWLPNKLEHQIQFMEEHHYHFSYHDYVEIDEQSSELGIRVSGPNRIIKNKMYCRNWLGCLSVMYDRKYYGLMQEKNVRFDDYSLWLQLIQKSDCYRLNECLAKYRRRQGSWSPKRLNDKIGALYQVFHQGMEMDGLSASMWTGMNLICQVIKKLLYTKWYETGV